MFQPGDRGFHPKASMIGHFPARYLLSGARVLDIHPIAHPMDHPRIILPISERDRDGAITRASP